MFLSDHNTRWRLFVLQTNTPTSIPRSRKGHLDVELSREYDRMATSLGTIGIGLVVFLFMLCIIGFCFLFAMNGLLWLKDLECIFISYHAWYRFYYILSCITFIIIIFFRSYTLNFKLGGGLIACLMTWVKV